MSGITNPPSASSSSSAAAAAVTTTKNANLPRPKAGAGTDAFKTQPYCTIHPLIELLTRLPPEITHQIFGLLPLINILEILCIGTPNIELSQYFPKSTTYLDACLITHPQWFRILFPKEETPPSHPGVCKHCDTVPTLGEVTALDPHPTKGWEIWHLKNNTNPEADQNMLSMAAHARNDYLQELKGHFKLYFDLCVRSSTPTKKLLDSLYLREAEWCERQGLIGSAILIVIKNAIVWDRFAECHAEYFLPVYRQFSLPSDYPISGTDKTTKVWDFSHLREQWNSVRAAEKRLMLKKASQLRQLVGLLEKYPRMILFGRHSSQDRQKDGWRKHVMVRLRKDARSLEMAKHGESEIFGKMIAGYVFKYRVFPLVPYDVFLQGFFSVIIRFPLSTKIYPGEIIQKIQIVLNGLAYYSIHTLPSRLKNDPCNWELRRKSKRREGRESPHKIPETSRPFRTCNTPFSAPEKQTPIVMRFMERESCPCHLVRDWRSVSNEYMRYIMPLVDEEFVWLEGFLEVCQWIRALDSVMWTSGVGEDSLVENTDLSVAGWWKKNVLDETLQNCGDGGRGGFWASTGQSVREWRSLVSDSYDCFRRGRSI